MFNYRHYQRGDYHICFNTKGMFKCPNPTIEDSKGHSRYHWDVGDHICQSIDSKTERLDKYTVIRTDVTKVTKLHKEATVNCPICRARLMWIGWRVWVEDVSEQKETGDLFRAGVKTVYRTWCKTLQRRRGVIDRLLEKYSED